MTQHAAVGHRANLEPFSPDCHCIYCDNMRAYTEQTLRANMKDLPPEFAEVVERHFWEILAK